MKKIKDLDENFIGWIKTQLGKNLVIRKEKYGDQSEVYCINTPRGSYFLKIAENLETECKKLKWLNGRLPIPEVIKFEHIGDKDVLLLSAVEGKNLAELKKEWPAEKVVSILAKVLFQFHTISTKDCPFGSQGKGKVLVHGDACLPNFIFKDDVFSGYIDLGDMRIDTPHIDLSAAVWSLQYNLGSGFGLNFLEKYGVKNATEELVEKLRLQYEETQKEWGL